MRIAALFLWMIVPLGLWGAVTLHGTPHLALSYRFFENGDAYNPTAPRRYIDCTYYGWSGVHNVPARNEHCPWIHFFKPEGNQ